MVVVIHASLNNPITIIEAFSNVSRRNHHIAQLPRRLKGDVSAHR